MEFQNLHHLGGRCRALSERLLTSAGGATDPLEESLGRPPWKTPGDVEQLIAEGRSMTCGERAEFLRISEPLAFGETFGGPTADHGAPRRRPGCPRWNAAWRQDAGPGILPSSRAVPVPLLCPSGRFGPSPRTGACP